MSSEFVYRIAKTSDIPSIKEIHKKYHISTISDEDKKSGFVTTNFTDEQLSRLINEKGFFVCLQKDKVIGYVTSASWDFWKEWPMYQHMISELPNLKYKDVINVSNSYQYGPVCVDKEYRGLGIIEKLFDISVMEMGKRYNYIITFINKANSRSFFVHTKKLKFEVINEFVYNMKKYYELIYEISK